MKLFYVIIRMKLLKGKTVELVTRDRTEPV